MNKSLVIQARGLEFGLLEASKSHVWMHAFKIVVGTLVKWKIKTGESLDGHKHGKLTDTTNMLCQRNQISGPMLEVVL